MATELLICKDERELFEKAAQEFIAIIAKAISEKGRAAVALSGGSTPRGLYELLASPNYRDQLDWKNVYFFWGDERCVPPNHASSNYRMAYETLLAPLAVPAENIYRIQGEQEDVAKAAADYEERLKSFFGHQPRFDLVLLGIGEDGHTASLFPDTAALEEQERSVAANHVEKLSAWRLTLTLPAINAAHNIVFIVTGAAKRAILHKVLFGKREYPSQLVKPTAGRLLWIVDRAAIGGED
ncbi:MAG: 6-phosphogluconolactonase [Acidobacteriota bacterium]|nr:6-phosphogluconolactonase [Blastocatellia bacterium]MDW8411900.1 6-phosphogluconolactonase [Acidobacteriota bacterium]